MSDSEEFPCRVQKGDPSLSLGMTLYVIRPFETASSSSFILKQSNFIKIDHVLPRRRTTVVLHYEHINVCRIS